MFVYQFLFLFVNLCELNQNIVLLRKRLLFHFVNFGLQTADQILLL